MGFRDFINGIVSWLVANVLPVLGTIFQGIADFINNVFAPALDVIIKYLGEILTPLFEQVGLTATAFMELVTLVAGAIGDALGRIMSVFSEAWTFIANILALIGIDVSGWSLTMENIFSTLALVVNNIIFPWINGIFNIIKGVFEGIVKFLTGIFKVIEGIFQVFTGILKGDWNKVWTGIQNVVKGVLGVIEAALRTAFGVIEGLVRTGLGIVDSIFRTIFGEGPGSIYSSIKGFIATVIKFGGDIIAGLTKGIGDAVGWAIGQITGFMGSIINGIKGFLGIKSPASIMFDIGLQIVKGLWKGINDAKDWIIGKLMAFIHDVIPGPIRDLLGIHSPSRLMAGIGADIVNGLTVGIEKTDSALRAMTNLSNDLVATAQGASLDMGFATQGAMNISKITDNTRNVNLSVDVTSSDGSVEKVDMDTLASLITGSDMVRALERMASVD
jgi:phage-related protein